MPGLACLLLPTCNNSATMNRPFAPSRPPRLRRMGRRTAAALCRFGTVLRHAVTVALLGGLGLAWACPAPDLVEVVPGVLVRHGLWPAQHPEGHGHQATSIVLWAGDLASVVDPGPTALEGRALMRALACRGLRRIDRVFNSHAHAEQVLANGALRAPVAATASAQASMRRRCPDCLAALRQDLGARALRGTRTVLPTQVLQAGDTLSAGGRTWQVLELPSAHTESDLALWSAAEGVLIAGGLLDGHGLVLAQGSVVGWLDALDRLQALQPQWLIGQYLVRDAAQVPTAFAAQREALCRLVRWSWQGLDAGWSEAEALNRLPVQGTPNAQRQQRFNLLRAWREMEALWLTQAPMPAACQPP